MSIFIGSNGKLQIDLNGKIKVCCGGVKNPCSVPCGVCSYCPDDCVKGEFNVVLSIPLNYSCYWSGWSWEKLITWTLPASWKVTYDGVNCRWTVDDLGSYTIRSYNGGYLEGCNATSYSDVTHTLGCQLRVRPSGWFVYTFKDGNDNTSLFYVNPISLGGADCNDGITVFTLNPVYGWMTGSGTLTFS
jgi:hypothetical protein